MAPLRRLGSRVSDRLRDIHQRDTAGHESDLGINVTNTLASALRALLTFAGLGETSMIRALVARWFIPLALATVTACGPSQSANAPAAPTANVSGTVAAQVQATVQALSKPQGTPPTTPAPVLPTIQTTATVNLPIVLDEHFATPP